MDRIQELLNEIDRLRMENMNLSSIISDFEDEIQYKDEQLIKQAKDFELDKDAHRALNKELLSKIDELIKENTELKQKINESVVK